MTTQLRIGEEHEELGREAGALLGRARARDAIHATVVALAVDDDRIVTSDPGDIHALVAAAGVHVDDIPSPWRAQMLTQGAELEEVSGTLSAGVGVTVDGSEVPPRNPGTVQFAAATA